MSTLDEVTISMIGFDKEKIVDIKKAFDN